MQKNYSGKWGYIPCIVKLQLPYLAITSLSTIMSGCIGVFCATLLIEQVILYLTGFNLSNHLQYKIFSWNLFFWKPFNKAHLTSWSRGSASVQPIVSSQIVVATMSSSSLLNSNLPACTTAPVLGCIPIGSDNSGQLPKSYPCVLTTCAKIVSWLNQVFLILCRGF